MRLELWADDAKALLLSKRMSYSLLIIVVLAVSIAIIAEFSPVGLKNAIKASAPGSSGIFEYVWVEEVLDKLFLLIFVSFGAFAVCDLEDQGMVELSLSRAQSRLEVILRRLTASFASFFFVFVAGSVMAGLVGVIIVGEMDFAIFLLHQLMVLPLCLFVFSLTFLLSVPLRTTATTVIVSFGISFALSFLYTYLLMSGDSGATELNPLALGYRVLFGLPLASAAGIAFAGSFIMLAVGIIWFLRKDL